MNKLRILIAADCTPMDEHILKFASFVNTFMGIQSATIFHVMDSRMMDAFISQRLHAQEPSIQSQVVSSLETKLRRYFKDEEIDKFNISVVTGNPIDEIENEIDESDYDLLILGNKVLTEGSGVIARRLFFKKEINVFFVPADPTLLLSKIAVPFDFSYNSLKAVNQAMELKSKNPGLEIDLIHVLKMLLTDYYFGLDENEFLIESHKKQVRKEFEEAREKYNLPSHKYSFKIIENEKRDIADQIVDYCRRSKCDLLIMGARGNSDKAFFPIGSITEKILHSCKDLPILITH